MHPSLEYSPELCTSTSGSDYERLSLNVSQQDRNPELCHSVTYLLRTEFDYISLRTTWVASQKNLFFPQNFPSQRPLPEIHAKWRPVIFEWFYKIVDHFLLDRGIVAIAMDYVDRYLLLHPASEPSDPINQKEYQLIAMSALYTAMKLHGGNDDGTMGNEWKLKRKTFCIKGFVKLSRGQFEPKDILNMETRILAKLSWKMNPVTFSCFLDKYMLLFPKPENFSDDQSRRSLKRSRIAIHVLHNLARYFVELGVCIPGITPYFQTEHTSGCMNFLAPSSVSYAALLLALDMMTLGAIPFSARQLFIERFAFAQKQILAEQPNSKYMLLTPDCVEVQKLKSLIHAQFEPSLLLGPLPGPEEGGINHHPFQIAKKAGMFHMEFFAEKNGFTKSPTSPLDDDSP